MKNIITILLIIIIPIITYIVITNNKENITANAKDKNNPTLIIFTSTMCMDCQKMKNVINEIEESYIDQINFEKINATEKNKKVQEQVKKYSIVLVPTLVFIDENGAQTNKIEGFIPKEELIAEIEEAING